MRQPELLKTLRSRITGGEFPPGSALPLRHVLLAEYGLSVATFQKSINRLIEEGFLESRGIKGTVVSEYPPHLCHYALVFPENPKQIGTVDTFFTALRSVGEELSARTPGMRLLHYFVDNTNSGLHQELARLIEDAGNHLLAGIIFVNFVPSPEIQTALIPCPCVVISRRSSDSYHEYPSLEFDSESLLARCLEYFHQRGRHRAAALILQNTSSERIIRMQNQLDPAHPEWVLGLDHIHARPQLNKNLLKLLFSLPEKRRPDALAVLNENFMPLVVEALLELGQEPGRDVLLAAHCNYPSNARRYPNTEYFTFPAEDVLQKAISLLKHPDGVMVSLIEPKPLSQLLKQKNSRKES